MDTRAKDPTKNETTFTIDLRHAALQAGNFLKNHASTMFVLALGIYSAYKLVNGKANKMTLAITNYESAFDNCVYNFPNSLGMLVDHVFPVNGRTLTQIRMGITIGVLQFLPAFYLEALERKYLGQNTQAEVITDEKELVKEKKSSAINFSAIASDIKKCSQPISKEFLNCGLFLTAYWTIFTKLGLKPDYALVGSIIVTQAISSYAHPSGSQLSKFTQGLFLSGLTLFNKGNLWPAVAAQVTHEALSCKIGPRKSS